MCLCYTLEGKKSVAGIEHLVRYQGRQYLRFGNAKLLIKQEGGSAHLAQGTKLIRAVPVIGRDASLVGFVGGECPNLIVIAIDTDRLDFEGEQNPFQNGISGWPGGEGICLPHFQRGGRSASKQIQIFVLTFGQQMIVVDQQSRVMSLSTNNGVPSLQSINRKDLILHLAGRIIHAKKYQEIQWCLNRLGEMGEHRYFDLGKARMHTLES